MTESKVFVCNLCQVEKPLAEKLTKPDRGRVCRRCHNDEKRKEYRLKTKRTPEQVKAARKKYSSLDLVAKRRDAAMPDAVDFAPEERLSKKDLDWLL